MYIHEHLMQARHNDRLRSAARKRLAAQVKAARRRDRRLDTAAATSRRGALRLRLLLRRLAA